MPRYQGREFTATIQAPTREDLDSLVEGLSNYAQDQGLGEVEVLQSRPDPDGGWEAIIKAHNMNPIQWIKERLRKRSPEPQQAGLPDPEGTTVDSSTDSGDSWWERRRARKEQERGETRREKAEEEAAYEERTQSIPPHLRGKYKERIKESLGAQEGAIFELWESGVPKEKTQLQRKWQPGYWTDKEGKAIPEPATSAGKAKAQYRPGEYVFERLQIPLSPQEQLAEARTQRVIGARVEAEVGELQEKGEARTRARKKRRLAPYKAVAGAAGGAARGLMAVTALGIAGTAQSIQPGRGGPEKAARMLAPRVPPEMYSVPRSPAAQPRVTPTTGGLGHLRDSLLPRMGTFKSRRLRLF